MGTSAAIREVLATIAVGKVLYEEKMARHTSLGVGGCADAVVFVDNELQLTTVMQKLVEQKIHYCPVGHFTNVIVRDGGYRGVLLVTTGMRAIRCEGTRVDAQAGASLSDVVKRTLAEELTGLEFCAGIPGTVGGAVWMNAGAYGKEMKDVLETVTFLDSKGLRKTVQRGDIAFGYRTSSFPRGAVILEAGFRLERGERLKMEATVSEILKRRREKHPLNFPSAGSIFKNLPQQPVGKLIEEMGLKGMRIGGAQISPKHANFIVNTGGATASDVLRLIKLIRDKAKKERNVDLETEVVIVGED